MPVLKCMFYIQYVYYKQINEIVLIHGFHFLSYTSHEDQQFGIIEASFVHMGHPVSHVLCILDLYCLSIQFKIRIHAYVPSAVSSHNLGKTIN